MEDNNKPCLFCTLKHILNAKTFLMESIQFGAKTKVSVGELNNLVLQITQYIQDGRKGGTNVRNNE